MKQTAMDLLPYAAAMLALVLAWVIGGLIIRLIQGED